MLISILGVMLFPIRHPILVYEWALLIRIHEQADCPCQRLPRAMTTAHPSVGFPFHLVGSGTNQRIGESRVIGDKYQETKIFAQLLRVARDLTKVDLIGNGTQYASTPAIYATELRNPDTNGAFYITIHTSSPSTDLTPFKLYVSTSVGNLTIPQRASDVVLNGRESKIIVTDFGVGNKTLIYSTAEIFTVSTQDNLPLVFLWLPAGESGEFLFSGVSSSSLLKSAGCSNVQSTKSNGDLLVSYTQLVGSCAIKFDNGYRFVLIDRSTAYATWVPSTSTDPYTPENSTGKSIEACDEYR
jgi:Beta-galactosidase, domain 2